MSSKAAAAEERWDLTFVVFFIFYFLSSIFHLSFSIIFHLSFVICHLSFFIFAVRANTGELANRK